MGGSIGTIIFCHNGAIFAAVGPPRAGPFIWTPATRTYQYGPPTHMGQWLLGLAAPPYYCLVSSDPIIVWAGILMTMEGSSGRIGGGPIAPSSISGGGFGNAVGGTNISGGGASGTGSISHVVISEVHYSPDSAHGGSAAHQWIEVYNPTAIAADLSSWKIQTTNGTQVVPSGTVLEPRGHMLFAESPSVRTLWSVPASTTIVTYANPFAGFVAAGDYVSLQTSSGTVVDVVSYGTNTNAFLPSVNAVPQGHSILRKTLSTDSDLADDWVGTPSPNPGR
jgi:Lamin Tail Domain